MKTGISLFAVFLSVVLLISCDKKNVNDDSCDNCPEEDPIY